MGPALLKDSAPGRGIRTLICFFLVAVLELYIPTRELRLIFVLTNCALLLNVHLCRNLVEIVFPDLLELVPAGGIYRF